MTQKHSWVCRGFRRIAKGVSVSGYRENRCLNFSNSVVYGRMGRPKCVIRCIAFYRSDRWICEVGQRGEEISYALVDRYNVKNALSSLCDYLSESQSSGVRALRGSSQGSTLGS